MKLNSTSIRCFSLFFFEYCVDLNWRPLFLTSSSFFSHSNQKITATEKIMNHVYCFPLARYNVFFPFSMHFQFLSTSSFLVLNSTSFQLLTCFVLKELVVGVGEKPCLQNKKNKKEKHQNHEWNWIDIRWKIKSLSIQWKNKSVLTLNVNFCSH